MRVRCLPLNFRLDGRRPHDPRDLVIVSVAAGRPCHSLTRLFGRNRLVLGLAGRLIDGTVVVEMCKVRRYFLLPLLLRLPRFGSPPGGIFYRLLVRFRLEERQFGECEVWY